MGYNHKPTLQANGITISWTPTLLSNRPLSIPRPCRVIQLEQQGLYIRSLARLGAPAILNDSPQAFRETADTHPLWPPWPITLRDSDHNRSFIPHLPERCISTKDLTHPSPIITKMRKTKLYEPRIQPSRGRNSRIVWLADNHEPQTVLGLVILDSPSGWSYRK